MKTNKLIEFKFLEDIVYYDGPLLSLGLTQDNVPVLEIWCDVEKEQNFHIYAYAFIQEEDFNPFINGEKSYLNVLKDSSEIIVFKYSEVAFDFEIMNNEEFIIKYGPKESCDLNDDLIDFRPKLKAFNHKQTQEIQ